MVRDVRYVRPMELTDLSYIEILPCYRCTPLSQLEARSVRRGRGGVTFANQPESLFYRKAAGETRVGVGGRHGVELNEAGRLFLISLTSETDCLSSAQTCTPVLEHQGVM